MTHTQNAYLWK